MYDNSNTSTHVISLSIFLFIFYSFAKQLYMYFTLFKRQCIGAVIVSVFALSAVDRGFEPQRL